MVETTDPLPTVDATVAPSVTTVARPGGTTGHGWQPGQSGNPLGRIPATIPVPKPTRPLTPPWEYVSQLTGNGRKVIAFLVAVMEDTTARRQDRLRAAENLLDRLWGKAPASLELTGPGGGPLQMQGIMAQVDTETLVKLVALRDQMLALMSQTPLLSEAAVPVIAAELAAGSHDTEVLDAGELVTEAEDSDENCDSATGWDHEKRS